MGTRRLEEEEINVRGDALFRTYPAIAYLYAHHPSVHATVIDGLMQCWPAHQIADAVIKILGEQVAAMTASEARRLERMTPPDITGPDRTVWRYVGPTFDDAGGPQVGPGPNGTPEQ